MYGIIGTVPDLQFPLLHGPARVSNDNLKIEDMNIPSDRSFSSDMRFSYEHSPIGFDRSGLPSSLSLMSLFTFIMIS